MRVIMITLYLISNITTVILAIYVCQSTPTVNQHVLSSAIFASFVLATIVTNVVYSLKCTYGFALCMTPQCVKDLKSDIKAVSKVRETFNGSKIASELIPVAVLDASDNSVFAQECINRTNLKTE